MSEFVFGLACQQWFMGMARPVDKNEWNELPSWNCLSLSFFINRASKIG